MAKIDTTQIDPKYHQTGWNYVTFPGGGQTANVTVTFPTTFSAAPKVFITTLGYKTGGAPAAVSDFTGTYSGGSTLPLSYVVSITTTGFTVYMQTTTGTFGASYGGFTWVAEI